MYIAIPKICLKMVRLNTTLEFFWRKGEGRDTIDKTNQVMQHHIPNEVQEDESIINTNDIVNKFFTGKTSDKIK